MTATHKRRQDALVDAAANLRKWRRIARRNPCVRNILALADLQDTEMTP